MSDDVVQVGFGALELPAVDGLGGFTGIFEGDTEVGAASASGFGGLELGCCVADLERQEAWLVAKVKVGRCFRHGRCGEFCRNGYIMRGQWSRSTPGQTQEFVED